MDKMRDKFISEISTLETALSKTKSKYLQRDYQKAIKRMKIELRDYDLFKSRETLIGE